MSELSLYQFFQTIVTIKKKALGDQLVYRLWDGRDLTLEVVKEDMDSLEESGLHGLNLAINDTFFNIKMKIAAALGFIADDILDGNQFFIKHKDERTNELFWVKYSFSGKSSEDVECLTKEIDREVLPYII